MFGTAYLLNRYIDNKIYTLKKIIIEKMKKKEIENSLKKLEFYLLFLILILVRCLIPVWYYQKRVFYFRRPVLKRMEIVTSDDYRNINEIQRKIIDRSVCLHNFQQFLLDIDKVTLIFSVIWCFMKRDMMWKTGTNIL